MSDEKSKGIENNEEDVRWRRTKKFSDKWKKRIVYKETSYMHNFTKEAIKKMIQLGKTNLDESFEKESFKEMCLRLNYNEKYLSERYRQLVIESRGMYAISLISIFVTFYSIGSMSILVIFSSLAMFFVFLLSGFVRAFRAYQIDIKEMIPFNKWLKSYDSWIL